MLMGDIMGHYYDTGKVNACHPNIVLHIPEREHTSQDKFNTLRKFNALRKGNTYHANFVLHNTPHTVALSYLQGERTPELHRLSWQCLDNTLKLEIGMLNPHTCVETHSAKLTHTVQTSYST